MSNLHSNNDIRCGLIMSVKINTAYVEHIYSEFMEGGELKYIRGSNTIGDETSHTNNFWDEFSTKYCNMFKYCMEDHDQELYYLFNEHLEDWKDYFIWYKEDEESDDYCKHSILKQFCRKCDEEDSDSDSDSDDEPLVPIAEGIDDENGNTTWVYDKNFLMEKDGKYYRKDYDDDWNETIVEVEKEQIKKRKIKINKK
jgi:hypothetical protein